MDEENKKIFTFSQAFSLGLITCVIGQSVGHFTTKNDYVPLVEKSRIAYVNKDTLPDLILGNGKIYLQKKEGGFVSYESFIQEQKNHVKDSIESKIEDLATQRTNLDTKYQLKIDSINKIYSK